jgi:HK97 family phage portal protein
LAKLQNWFNKNIWDLSTKSLGGTYDLKGTEAWSKVIGFDDNFSSEIVTERRAHGIATVYTCINVRSQTLASLPINVIRETEKGDKDILVDHPVYYPLAHQPNSYMSSANMFLTSMIHSDSWGNSYIGINRNGRGEVRSFDMIQPWDVDEIKVMNGNAFYKVRGEVYNSRDILHFRWFSYDGLNGISPIRNHQMTMGKAVKSERYSAYALGKTPPMILSYEGNQTPEQKAENQKTWEKDLMTGKTPILSGRWDVKQLMLNPVDIQYVQSEALTDRKIYGIFRIPPVFAQDFERATFTNAEQSDLIFAKHTITPIVRMIEQECNMKLFSEREKKNTYMKFNLNGLLRGDTKARAEFYNKMRNIGAMNANEIRSLEDMNAYEGGDIYTVQGANVPIDQLREFYSSKVAPTAPDGKVDSPSEDSGVASKMNGKAKHYSYGN